MDLQVVMIALAVIILKQIVIKMDTLRVKDLWRFQRLIGSTIRVIICQEYHVSLKKVLKKNYKRFLRIIHQSGPTRGPVKRTPGRLPRIPFTPHQLNELEDAFKTATYLSTEDANKLAKRLDLTGVRVKIWFQNRRARDRRERRDTKNKHDVKPSDDNDEEIIVS